jgi:hypothetical protein
MIEYEDPKIVLKITPRAETAGDYFYRTYLLAKIANTKDIPEWQQFTYFFDYPVCLSCVTGTYQLAGEKEKDIREMSIDEFLELIPGAVARVWSDKVLELNKHLYDFEPADNKKKSALPSASQSSTRRKKKTITT